jgi:hypothetical protein
MSRVPVSAPLGRLEDERFPQATATDIIHSGIKAGN